MARSDAELTQAVADLGGDLDAVFGEVGIAAGLADRDGIIRWQNARATEIAGDCIGQPLATIVAPESANDWRIQFSKKVLGTARTTDYQITMLMPDGTHVPVDISSVAVEGSDHRIVGVFGMIEPVAPPFERPPLADTGLTPRQLEILQHLDHGLSTKQIADRLGIQPETVRNHIRALLRALGVHSRLEAVAVARRGGILPG